jgi:hypothetical protein
MLSRVEFVPMNRVAVTAFVFCVGAGAIVSALINRPAPLIAGGIVGIYLLFAIKVAQQWEKVALMRLGKYVGLRARDGFMCCRSLRPSATISTSASVFTASQRNPR